jgi:hypothetical protein
MEKLCLATAPQYIFNSLKSRYYPSQQAPGINHVLIFKTNVQTQTDKLYLKTVLDKHRQVEQWNIDLEDVDCVLRIVSRHLKHSDVIKIISQYGFYCEELV